MLFWILLLSHEAAAKHCEEVAQYSSLLLIRLVVDAQYVYGDCLLTNPGISMN
jgi:hypothetical protein